jgi:hypothetical protein
MTRLVEEQANEQANEQGGVITKLLGVLLILGILATAVLYVYGKNQQPLSAEGVHVATSDGGRQSGRISVAPGRTVYVATIVRNDGPLPVTLEGLAQVDASETDAYIPVSLQLGDGKTPAPADGAFVPPSLDPHTGIGVVVTYAIDPKLACRRLGDTPSNPAPLAAIPMQLSTYGVDTTQTLGVPGPPVVDGLTKTTCERALG